LITVENINDATLSELYHNLTTNDQLKVHALDDTDISIGQNLYERQRSNVQTMNNTLNAIKA